MTLQPLDEYFSALDRLKKARPKNVPMGTKITNDSVSIEAGREKGSIKKSRPVFSDLIAAIKDAASVQANPENAKNERLKRAKNEAYQYRQKYEETLAREVSLVYEIYSLKKRLSKLTGENVFPLRGASTNHNGHQKQ